MTIPGLEGLLQIARNLGHDGDRCGWEMTGRKDDQICVQLTDWGYRDREQKVMNEGHVFAWLGKMFPDCGWLEQIWRVLF